MAENDKARDNLETSEERDNSRTNGQLSKIKRSRSRSRSPVGNDRDRRGGGSGGKDRRAPIRRDRNDAGRGRGGRANNSDKRVYVANLPYDMKWQEVKDLFRDKVGEVTYVQLFDDEKSRPRGCGIIEFADSASVDKSIDALHRFEVKGRQLVVKEDFNVERDRYGRPLRRGDRIDDDDDDRNGMDHRNFGGRGRDMGRMSGGGGGGGGPGPMPPRGISGGLSLGPPGLPPNAVGMGSLGGGGGGGGGGPGLSGNKWGNTYGLSPQFLESLGIDGPLLARVFVANLDFKIDEKKIRDIFKLAGTVTNVELKKDKDGNSKGHGVVEFSHPVEAVQAISMFNGQSLYDRKMSVRMDKFRKEDKDGAPPKLPDGLKGIGMGLGAGGTPLSNISTSLGGMGTNPGVLALGGTGIGGATNTGMMGGGGGLPDGLSSNLGMGGLGGGAGSLGGVGLGASAGLAHNPMFSASNVGMMSNPGMPAAQLGMLGAGTAGLGGTSGLSAAPSSLTGLSAPNTVGMGGLGSSLGASLSAGLGNALSSIGASLNSAMVGNPMAGHLGSGLGGALGSTLGGGGGIGLGANSLESDYRAGLSQYTSMRPSQRTIIIRNLPYTYTWTSLKEKLRDIGDVDYAEIRTKGVGVVRFTSERDAQRALAYLNRSRVEGRTIEVSLE